MDDYPERPLVDVLRSVVRRWRTAALTGVPVVGLVLLWAMSLPTTWAATAVVAFSPRADVAVGADSVSLVLPGYVAFATSPAVAADVADRLGLTTADVQDALEVVVPPTTATIEVTATSEDEDVVADLANRIALEVRDRAATDPILNTEIASRAVDPRVPSGPARTVLLVAGSLAALLLGGAAALLHERLVPRVDGGRSRMVDLPVLARVPRSPLVRFPESWSSAASADSGSFGISVRALRDRLPVLTVQPSGMVIAVCSPSRSEGRTSVAAVLAHSFTRVGARVLLVDGDADRAALTTHVSKDERRPGLEDVLDGRADLDAALVATAVPGLTLLPANTTTPFADVLARQHRRLGEVLRQRLVSAGRPGWEDTAPAFDVVIVDTPPVLSSDEAGLLARAADGVLLVAVDGASLGPLQEAAGLLTSMGTPPLGIVVNQVRRSATSLGGAKT